MKRIMSFVLMLFLFFSCGKTENWADLDSYIKTIEEKMEKHSKNTEWYLNNYHAIQTSQISSELQLGYTEYEEELSITSSDPTVISTGSTGMTSNEIVNYYSLGCAKVGITILTIKYTLTELETGQSKSVTKTMKVTCKEA